MRSLSAIVALTALVGMAAGIELPASAQTDAPWSVDGKLLGKDQKKSKDVSGIACLSGGLPRKCLVIDDEVQFAQVVIVQDGSLLVGDTIRLVDPDNGKWNIDGEGVAFSAGVPPKPDHFYIVGSHGHPRDREGKLDAVDDAGEIKARFDAASVLIRLQIDPASISGEGKLKKTPKGETLVDLRPMIHQEPKLAPLRPFLGRRLEEKKRGVRDLAAHGTNILILAGPAYEPNAAAAAGKTGEYAIYLWDRANEPRKLKDLPPYEEKGKALKPEALLPLRTNNDGTLDVLVLFDGATEGGPRLVKILR